MAAFLGHVGGRQIDGDEIIVTFCPKISLGLLIFFIQNPCAPSR
jgi:hypothetical protein